MPACLTTDAIVIDRPGSLTRRSVDIAPLAAGGNADHVHVRVESCGISTGTERLLWNGTMPVFPGLSYPLVPGYEAVGRVIDAADDAAVSVGARVFVPGSAGYRDGVAGLFGANAADLVVPAARCTVLDDVAGVAGERATLLALAATAMHVLAAERRRRGLSCGLADLVDDAPDLIVGHGVLGRLLARLVVAIGAPAPCVTEVEAARRDGAIGYEVLAPDAASGPWQRIVDVSGAGGGHIDTQITSLARGGELVLAGFYAEPIAFDFAPAFMRELRIRVAAEWQPEDLALVLTLLNGGALSLDGLVSHRSDAANAAHDYPEAFRDASRLKTVLDWSH